MIVELGTCSRLCARISPDQCKRNRQSGTFACTGCVGLNNIEVVVYQPILHDPNPEQPLVYVKSITIPLPEKENDMNKRGTCPTCKREDVTMPSATKCFRCYSRSKQGLDPISGEPVSGASEKPEVKPTTAKVKASATSFIAEVSKADSIVEHFNVNPVQCFDDAWSACRARWVAELTAAPDHVTRLRLAANMLESMNRLAV